jgi:FKBP-type peptidyl-prolyl cis-trans isomerase FkpA
MKNKHVCGMLAVILAAGLAAPLSACELHSKEKTGSQAVKPDESVAMAAVQAGGLKIEDVVVGTGKPAKSGETVTVNYRGTLVPSGKQFDSSYDRKAPFTFKLGAGEVIEGWDKGIQGMKVGGKRILVIPPEQAYGEGGYPPVIPKNATLKFEVELLGVQ